MLHTSQQLQQVLHLGRGVPRWLGLSLDTSPLWALYLPLGFLEGL